MVYEKFKLNENEDLAKKIPMNINRDMRNIIKGLVISGMTYKVDGNGIYTFKGSGKTVIIDPKAYEISNDVNDAITIKGNPFLRFINRTPNGKLPVTRIVLLILLVLGIKSIFGRTNVTSTNTRLFVPRKL